MDNDIIRLGVIGCGHWGPNHVRVFNDQPGSYVAIVADPEKGQLRRVQELHTGVRGERDYLRLLSDATLDAVVVATPTSTHYQIVREALVAGKHVLCEKPLCLDARQGKELIDLARSKKRVLMVGHVFLFNGGILKLKELIDNDDLGKVQCLAAMRTNLGPIRSDVNVAFDLAAHDIAIFNWLLGSEPQRVSATGASFVRPGIEDIVFVTLEYPGGVITNVRASWLEPRKNRQITCVGSRAMATWDDLDLSHPVAIYDKGAGTEQMFSEYGEFLRIAMWDGDVRLPRIDLEEPLKVQDRYFLDCIRRNATEFRSDGPFGQAVVRVLEGVQRSLAKAGAMVSVDAE